jgi:4-hydroxy 2-oxovalerate aldolase
LDLNNNITLLDCSLRDGGYYNNWDFEESFVAHYRDKIKHLPIDYIEIGYRNFVQKEYRGKYFYCPLPILDQWVKFSHQLVLMLDEINTPVEEVDAMIQPCIGKAKMFRIATKPNRISQGIALAKKIKRAGFEVGLNIMYLSEWDQYDDFFDQLKGIENHIDYLYMADSYGAVLPDYIVKTVKKLKSITSVKLGYHGHNNLEMGLINALKAIELGVEIIDASITGMGRGAGNLKTELLLTYLAAEKLKEVNFEYLDALVNQFETLQATYQWGNNLAYMVSGANSIPQKEVMNLITRRYYSIDNAIKYLGFKPENEAAKKKYPKLNAKNSNASILIIGGGPSTPKHLDSIKSFIHQNKGITLLFSSARYIAFFSEFNDTYTILVGAEGKRLEGNISIDSFNSNCILPPPPHKITPYIPEGLIDQCLELNGTIFSKENCDAHLAVTLQAAIELGGREIFLIGFDGYTATELNEKEAFLMQENQLIFDHFIQTQKNIQLKSLSPTAYENIAVTSIYAMIK